MSIETVVHRIANDPSFAREMEENPEVAREEQTTDSLEP
jgi:hypothetical protein